MKMKIALAVVIALTFMGGGYYVAQRTTWGAITSKAELQRRIQDLNGRKVSGFIDGGLTLENVTLKGTTFIDVEARNSHFKNVIFEDCTFIKVDFRESTFENVSFIGGKMAYRGDTNFRYNLTNFAGSVFSGTVLFDSVTLDNAYISGIQGGNDNLVVFRNMQGIRNGMSVINGDDINLRVENCSSEEYLFAALFENSTIYAINSTFTGSGFAGKAEAVYIDNCKLLDGSTGGVARTVVIKNSILCGGVGNSTPFTKHIYLINNQYPETKQGLTTLACGDSTTVFIDGRNVKNACMAIFGGKITVRDVNFDWLRLSEKTAPSEELNFHNVTIRKGDWRKVTLKSGQWENVTIYPPVQVPDATIQNVKTRYLTFPQGSPWVDRNSATSIDIQDSPIPFEWPEVHVPTPEELGIKPKDGAAAKG